ncbi:MarR family winged helix-turn-helix transcriptional regulator [Halanaerobaculum tunisiense]
MFDIETCIAFLTNKTSKKLADAFNKRLECWDITRVQWIALYYLGKYKDLSQKELGELMNIKGSSVAGLINRLEKQGYVEKRRNPQDKRKFNLHLTNKGQEIREKTLPEGNRMSQICSEGISENEIEVFKKVLNKMIKNIDKV